MQKEKEQNKKEEVNRLSAKQITLKTLKHWPWVLVSLAIWITLAFIYLQIKQPTYMRTAKMLLTDESGRNSFSLPTTSLSFGMLGSNQELLDEMSKLQSPDLLETVIKRLNIDYKYEKPGDLHRDQAYGDSLAISVEAPTWTDDDFAKMTIDIARNGDVYISDIRFNKDKFDFEQNGPGRLGHPIKTPAGYITVSSNPNFRKGREYTFYMTKLPINDAIKAYNRAIEISNDDDRANVIGITAYDKSATRAKDIVQTIIDVYNENWVNHKNTVTDVTTRFIDERLEGIKNELLMADMDISNFQSAHQLPDLEKAAAIYLTDNQMADQHLLELTNQVKVARYMRNYMEGAAHTNEVLPTFTSLGIGTSALERQISEYNEKLMERNRLASNSSSSHPMIVQLDQQLEQMRSAIINSTNNEIASLNTQIENVLSKKSEVENKIAAAPKQVNTILETGRQQKVLESLYVFLLQKREENEMNRTHGLLNNEIIAKPRGDWKPVKPRKPLLFAVAVLMGLLTPYCITFIREVRDTKVNSRKDLEGLNLPLLGEIPAWKHLKKHKKDDKTGEYIVVEKDNNDAINDAFRMLRTNIFFLSRNSEGCSSSRGEVMMLTSLKSGNGKTFVSVNLAASLALPGKRVMLIDGDLRHGDTSKSLTQNTLGFSDYLLGAVSDWHDMIVADDALQGADLMPIGHIPPNPTELLESNRFEKMIREMRDEYDFILIDCPSVDSMADAKIIEKAVDRSVFVIRAGKMECAELPEFEKLYTEKTFKNMSVILNGIKMPKKASYSGTEYHKA